MKKRLIEWDLPLADISEESAIDRNLIHGHPSSLHIWWARKPLAASRAITMAACLPDPGENEDQERAQLIDLIKKMLPWSAVKDGDSKTLMVFRELLDRYYETPPKFLDPFAGGGSIPLEALRLGCDTYAGDYNPVAFLIEKATIEWPQKFGHSIQLPDADLEFNKSYKQLELSTNNEKRTLNLLEYLVGKWAYQILEQVRIELKNCYPLVLQRKVDQIQTG